VAHPVNSRDVRGARIGAILPTRIGHHHQTSGSASGLKSPTVVIRSLSFWISVFDQSTEALQCAAHCESEQTGGLPLGRRKSTKNIAKSCEPRKALRTVLSMRNANSNSASRTFAFVGDARRLLHHIDGL
jgi:hypothetical protein